MLSFDKKKTTLTIVVILVGLYILYAFKFTHTLIDHVTGSKNRLAAWSDTYSLSLLCRTYSGTAMELYNIFLVSYLLFWPFNEWKNSDVIVVFDDENELDHRMGTILANLPPYPKVFFEKYPRKEKTFCSNWRSEGYSRQQYSNFYSDLYTDRDYIGRDMKL